MRNTFTIAAALVGLSMLHAADAQQIIAPYATIAPNGRASCFQILELQSLRIDPQTGNMQVYPGQFDLARDYNAVVAWLQGFLSASNVLTTDHPDRSAINPQLFRNWMTWLFSYCRANPENTLAQAAVQLANAIAKH